MFITNMIKHSEIWQIERRAIGKLQMNIYEWSR